MRRFKNFLLERVDTTQTASVTELFPTIAFNMKQKPSSVEEFKKFLYRLNTSKFPPKIKKSFVNKSNMQAGASVIEKLSSMEDRFVKTKIENAIGITNYLYDLDSTKPIKNIIWGYREKPKGIPKNHAGDIFVFFKDGDKIGISLKAGTKKSKEPLKNTYVGTQYRNLDKDITKLENILWDKVYSKIPNVNTVAKKSNYTNKGIKDKVTELYLDYFLENEDEANELYKEMLKVTRQQFCKILNSLSVDEFIEWAKDTFNLQRKGEDVPLILVKAVGKSAEQKSDDIVDILPLVTKHHAYLNKNSVQEYYIDIHTPEDKKTLIMTIRSDSGVRKGKKPGAQGRLGQYTMLKMQYSGTK